MAEVTLAGSRVLVLGGSGVLGGLIAAELRRRGATVMLAGRDRERLHRRAAELGPDVPSVTFDLQHADHARFGVETAVQTLGGLDGVVNAAGVVGFGTLAETDDARLEELITTNLTGPLRVMRAALEHMSEGGYLVTISGVVAEQPVAGLSAYTAAKAGLAAAVQALRREVRRQGVHVLDARPPHTETGLASRAIFGQAPRFAPGLDPGTVATTIVDALARGTRELPAAAFTTQAA